MSEYKIVVDFNNQSSNNNKKKKAEDDFEKQPQEEDDGFDLKKMVKKVGASALVAGTFKWQLSLVGRNQGNSLTQDKINGAMAIAGQIGGIVAGFAAGGVLGGVLAIAGVGLSYVKDAEQYNYEAKWENIGLSLARERAGSSSAVNRSRNV